MKIRPYNRQDLEQMIQLFQQTVYSINKMDYSPSQIDAWVNATPKESRSSKWNSEFIKNYTYVAEEKEKIVGFIDMTPKGYLDRLYVHSQFQRMGIASQLLKKIETIAYQCSLSEISTDASITARPFFEEKGFKLMTKQIVEINEIKLTNYQMIKKFV